MFLGRGGRTLLEQRPFRLIQRLGRLRMHRHGRVAQQRLGPGRGHRHALGLARFGVDDVVADMPEVALHRLVKDLVIADGRLEEGVPVHKPFATANEALLEEPQERRTDSNRALVVEREASAIPVAARAQVPQLAENPLLVLLFPGPDPLHQLLPAEVVPREFFLLQQPPLDNRLRRDAGMVGAGHPEREESLHSPRADEHVLERVVERVAQMEGAGDIRRRDDNRKDFPTGLGLGVPGAVGIPERAAAGLRRLMIVMLGQFVHVVSWETAKCSGKWSMAATGITRPYGRGTPPPSCSSPARARMHRAASKTGDTLGRLIVPKQPLQEHEPQGEEEGRERRERTRAF